MAVALIGRVLLWVALAAALAATLLLAAGERAGRPAVARAGRAAFWVLVAGVVGAALLLLGALGANDFHLAYVAQHSSAQTPWYFRLAALWGGQQGSLLLWLLILCLYGAYLLARPPREAEGLLDLALAVIAAAASAFGLLVAQVASPFVYQGGAPADGVGLNALLRADSFLLHPVAIYFGFVGFTVPFAFAMAGLLRGETGDRWIRLTHRWALTAWGFLSLGILLGAHWSYHVLGWGGYWDFDPIENAALLPWLLGTAFIHSAMVQERRGMLKVWNAALIAGTYVLTLFGTFLTRSGVADSVHTFAESPIGGWLIAYCGIAAAGAIYLIGSRLDLLQDERQPDSLVSKEGAFLLNNVVFLALALSVFVGTVVPILSPYFGPTVSVGPPYFKRVSAPLFTIALLLAGVGPLLAWRRAGRREFTRHLLVPLLAAAAFSLVVVSAGVRPLSAVIAFSCAFFAAAAVGFDFGLAVAARRQMQPSGVAAAAWHLVQRNPRRYGGYAVHLAMAIIAFGVVASNAYERQYLGLDIPVGGSVRVAGWDLTYEGLGARPDVGAVQDFARVVLSSGGRLVGTLLPGVSVGSDQATGASPTFEPAIHSGVAGDVYVVLEGYPAGGASAVFNVYLVPLVGWIWAGGLLLVAGTLWSLWPRRAALAAPRSARVFSLWSELEYDHRMGKTTEADYAALRARFAAEAEAALRSEGAPAAAALQPALEAQVRQRVRELVGSAAAGPDGAEGPAEPVGAHTAVGTPGRGGVPR